MDLNNLFIWNVHDMDVERAKDMIKNPEFYINNVVVEPMFMLRLIMGGYRDVMKLLMLDERLDKRLVPFNHDLQIACIVGDKDRVEELLKKPELLNHEKFTEFPPLCLASAMGHTEIVELLIQQEWVDVNQELWHVHYNSGGELRPHGSALHMACFSKHRGMIELLCRDPRTNVKMTSSLYTPLHIASTILSDASTFMALVPFIETANMDINSENEYGDTPFALACIRNKDVAKFMLNHRKDVDYNKGLDEGKSIMERMFKYVSALDNDDEEKERNKEFINDVLIRDKRIQFPKITLEEGNKILWEIIILGMAIEPSRIPAVSYSDDFKEQNGTLSALWTSDNLQYKTEVLRLHTGMAYENAAFLWMTSRFVDEGIVEVSGRETGGVFERFFDLTLSLPLELQMLVSNRVYGINEGTIEPKQIQKQLEVCNV